MRDRIGHKVQLKNLELLDLSDLSAWVERDGQQQQIPLKHVLKGDKVTVHSGEMILVDLGVSLPTFHHCFKALP